MFRAAVSCLISLSFLIIDQLLGFFFNFYWRGWKRLPELAGGCDHLTSDINNTEAHILKWTTITRQKNAHPLSQWLRNAEFLCFYYQRLSPFWSDRKLFLSIASGWLRLAPVGSGCPFKCGRLVSLEQIVATNCCRARTSARLFRPLPESWITIQCNYKSVAASVIGKYHLLAWLWGREGGGGGGAGVVIVAGMAGMAGMDGMDGQEEEECFFFVVIFIGLRGRIERERERERKRRRGERVMASSMTSSTTSGVRASTARAKWDHTLRQFKSSNKKIILVLTPALTIANELESNQ